MSFILTTYNYRRWTPLPFVARITPPPRNGTQEVSLHQTVRGPVLRCHNLARPSSHPPSHPPSHHPISSYSPMRTTPAPRKGGKCGQWACKVCPQCLFSSSTRRDERPSLALFSSFRGEGASPTAHPRWKRDSGSFPAHLHPPFLEMDTEGFLPPHYSPLETTPPPPLPCSTCESFAYLLLDREAETSIKYFALQLFTVPTVSGHLARNHRLIQRLSIMHRLSLLLSRRV